MGPKQRRDHENHRITQLFQLRIGENALFSAHGGFFCCGKS
jgi:hypothetical protein